MRFSPAYIPWAHMKRDGNMGKEGEKERRRKRIRKKKRTRQKMEESFEAVKLCVPVCVHRAWSYEVRAHLDFPSFLCAHKGSHCLLLRDSTTQQTTSSYVHQSFFTLCLLFLLLYNDVARIIEIYIRRVLVENKENSNKYRLLSFQTFLFLNMRFFLGK